MNLLILENHEFLTESEATVNSRKALHIQTVLKLKEGETIKVGRLNGKIGSATVAAVGEHVRLVEIDLLKDPPKKLNLRLIVALPRPKVFRRLVRTITELGVHEVIFVNSMMVDKAYWGSHFFNNENIQKSVLLGLEQSGDTIVPKFKFERLFKPFVEDRLSAWSADDEKWLAHPHLENGQGFFKTQKSAVAAIGPEGGWIPYEVEKFSEFGFQPIRLGPRILRVETAVQMCIAKLT